jgi:hypothetical protein
MSLSATVYKGQKEFVEQCKKCHGSSLGVSRLYKKDEWTVFFENNATKIKNLHRNTDANNYFFSKDFQNNIKNLYDLFNEYAKDGEYPSPTG